MSLPDFEQGRYRVLVEVVGPIDPILGMVNLKVPGWNPDAIIPIASVRIQPCTLLESLGKGGMLLATVNLAAATPAELMFQDFMRAPEPISESELS